MPTELSCWPIDEKYFSEKLSLAELASTLSSLLCLSGQPFLVVVLMYGQLILLGSLQLILLAEEPGPSTG